ncbi:hypothetical protein ABIB99_005279 [Bradyrhizobium sp. LA6.1]|uniref:nuclear transport factor 2 family protein n=1 Tax=Bradyrhizobium sp. LA6.1 TaxID=3156378 RepID=UPI00339156A3
MPTAPATIEAILGMYADDAIVPCACGGMKTISTRQGLRAYWVDRLRDCPASHLDDLNPSVDGAAISYIARDGVVSATLTFNASGKIASLTCRPLN